MPNRPQSGPAFSRAGEPSLSLRVLVDRSIVEAYAQGGRASAISRKRHHPAGPGLRLPKSHAMVLRAGAYPSAESVGVQLLWDPLGSARPTVDVDVFAMGSGWLPGDVP